MNRYELALHETTTAIIESSNTPFPIAQKMGEAVVDRLIAEGLIQSTMPGDLIPNGLTDGVHRATPFNGSGLISEATCRHCGVPIKPVPGGSGMTWVHTATGAVAGSGGER